MAEPIMRQQVQNPLAVHPKENQPSRQLGLQGVQNPRQTGGNERGQQMAEFFGVMDRLRGTVSQISDLRRDHDLSEGKIAYMSGVTEEAMAQSGNRYNMQGWQSMNAVDQANQLYMRELSDMESYQHLTPEQYQKHMMQQRKKYLDNMPKDPAVRKMFAAAFDSVGPRVASQHAQAHNAWNENQTEREFTNLLSSGSVANSDRSIPRSGHSSLKLSDSVVDRPYNVASADERDIAIKTMLGEAGAEGELGMAAVAHVLKNRQGDARWGGTIKSVALAPNQFSTWNAGAGGNNPGRYKPGSALYEKAGRVFDAVMSGRHVDPTGGATHYYSPRGMQKLVNDGDQGNIIPGWLKQEEARSGGQTRIGGHIFVGRSSGSSVGRAPLGEPAGDDGQWRQDVDPEGDLGLYGPTMVFPQDRVAEAHAAGNVLLSPTNSDLEVQPGVAPDVVAQAQGIPVQDDQTYQSQTQELIRGFNGFKSPERKAQALAAAMVRQLQDGDDSLFVEAGGVAMLNELGASPDLIDKVQKAKRVFNDKDADRFNVEEERWRQSIQDRALQGDESVMQEIEDRAMNGDLDHKTAQSLYRQVAGQLSKVGNRQWANNPDVQEEMVNISQFIKDGGDMREAVTRIRAMEDEYGIPRDDGMKFLDQMYNVYEQRLDRDRTAAASALKRAEENAANRAAADQALAQGYGLNDVTGKVMVDDGKGNMKEVSAKEYGIMRLKASEYQNARKMQAEGTDPDQARAVAEANVYSALRKQQVVDEEMQNYITGSVTGNIITSDGKVNPEALKSFEFYMRMADNPDVGEAYIGQYVKDTGAGALMELARGLYDGNLDLEPALRKAYQTLNDPNVDTNRKLAKDGVFSRAINARIGELVNDRHGNTFWGTVFGDWGFSYEDQEVVRQTALAEGSPLRNAIERNAQAIYMTNPRMGTDVAVRLASKQVAQNTDFVAGNIVIGNAQSRKKLSQVMGVEALGPRGPEDAIDWMLSETGSEIFGEIYDKQARWGEDQRNWPKIGRALTWMTLGLTEGITGGSAPQMGLGTARKVRDSADYELTYDSNNGVIGIQLYKKGTNRQELIGPVRSFNARDLGRDYLRAIGRGEFYEPGIIERTTRNIMDWAAED